jgi:hypothetical protein
VRNSNGVQQTRQAYLEMVMDHNSNIFFNLFELLNNFQVLNIFPDSSPARRKVVSSSLYGRA